MAQQDVLVLKDKVQRYLTDLIGVFEVDRHGDFTFQIGSARVFVSVGELSNDRTYIGITVPLLFEVPPSPEVFKHIALHADDWIFGHLSAVEHDTGVNIFFSHRLLGDYLDPEEFRGALIAVAGTSDQLDNELQAQFGGRRFHDDVAD
jgi:hypothetical protein